jgi:outer membrane protein assembly factor BamB/5-hydroxyisourate hydrolase-like protein (transthyretin family)
MQSSPAVVNGVVYVGSIDGNVYALNAATGAKVWNYTTGGAVDSSPAVVNGVVYVGSIDGNVYALNAATGAKVWNYTTGWYVPSSPAVVNGVVYVGGEFDVYALNAATGAKVWNYTAPDSIYGASPAVANGMVYIAGGERSTPQGGPLSAFYALNATTGELEWNYTINGDGLSSPPSVANGVVYMGCQDDNVYALNAYNGAKLWNYTTGGWVEDSPAIANGVVYIGSDDGNVYALNAATGAKVWNYAPVNETYRSSPAVVNGVVYEGSIDGNVYAIGNQSQTIPTALTAAVAPSTVIVNQNFTINGTLNTTGGTPIAGATIQLQKNVSRTWTNVSTTSTDANGNYSFSLSEPVAGTYQFQTTDAGTSSILPATSNVVTVEVVTYPTQLTAVANTTTVAPNQNFTINGTLNTTESTPVAGAAIQLQKNVSGTWTNVMTNVTDSTGGYQFSQNESANGTYYYRTAYDGNDTYANATSNTVNVTVFSVSRLPTTLSATISSKFVAVNKQFSINGTLSAGTTGLGGAAITLQRSANNATWNNVTNTATNAAGQYQFGRNESTTHIYYYRTIYDGGTSYVNATSNVVTVTVVSKASVLADLNALSLTVLGTPNSAFIPGTKIATLAVIGAAKVNFMVGSYGGATTELKSALLPRMDGCAKTGKPDSDDWVRTCAAQGQLYPQVQNLIQELKALQGS